MDFVSNFLIKADKACDFVPILSIVSNGVDLILKIALSIFEKIVPQAKRHLNRVGYIRHLKDKHPVFCIILSIPVVNFFMAIALHFPQAIPDQEEPRENPAIQALQRRAYEHQQDMARKAEEAKALRAETKANLEARKQELELELQELINKRDQELSGVEKDSQKYKLLKKIHNPLISTQKTVIKSVAVQLERFC